MQLHKDITNLPAIRNAVLTIGSFDGVHRGHHTILKQLVDKAKNIGGSSMVITFFPHPKIFLGAHNASSVRLLNTIEEKAALLEKYGIDHLVLVPFTAAFAVMEAEQYISDFLVKRFNPHTIIIGHDHRFGKNRTGDFELMKKCSSKYGFNVIEIPEFILSNITISSTVIREKINKGEFPDVNNLLGYEYALSGVIVRGNQIGRTIGFPTANLTVTDELKLIPCNGVYAVRAFLNGPEYLTGMMNIGTRPTVEGKERSIEVHLFDFDKEIYHETLTVCIIQKIRDEKRFSGLTALQNQLKWDESYCKQLFKSPI